MSNVISLPHSEPHTTPTYSPIETLAVELGAIAARIERDLKQSHALQVSELEKRIAQLELLVHKGEVERNERCSIQIANVRDGKDATVDYELIGKQIERSIVDKFADITKANAEMIKAQNESLDAHKQAIEFIIAKAESLKDGRDGRDGVDGVDGVDGKDAVVDYDLIRNHAATHIEETIGPYSSQIAELLVGINADFASQITKIDERLANVRDGVDGKDADSELIIKQVMEFADRTIDDLIVQINDRLAQVKDGVDGKDGVDAVIDYDYIHAHIDNSVKQVVGPIKIESDISKQVVHEAIEELEEKKVEVNNAVFDMGLKLGDAIKRVNEKIDERLSAVKDGRDGVDGTNGVGIKAVHMHGGHLILTMDNDQDIDVGNIRGPKGKKGKLPTVKEWTARVHYQGDVVTHDGELYQALKDTGGAPPSEDWRTLVTKGRDAVGWTHKGAYNENGLYKQNDVVTTERSSFVALKDDPGQCPGEGWRLVAGAGSKGKEGVKGQSIKGDKGDKGSKIIDAKLGDDLFLTFVMDDGEKIEVDLNFLLEALDR